MISGAKDLRKVMYDKMDLLRTSDFSTHVMQMLIFSGKKCHCDFLDENVGDARFACRQAWDGSSYLQEHLSLDSCL
jgi:hypothetical protein